MLKKWLESFSKSRKLRPCWNLFYSLVTRLTKQSIIARSPALYRLYAKWCKPDDFWTFPDGNTDLVVESVGCSASFALVAYIEKHNPGIRIAHGCEVPASVIYAVEHRLPVIVPTRNLLDTVRSGVDRYPQNTPKNIMRNYHFFTRAIQPLVDRILVVDFHNVRSDPQGVLNACNKHFGTALNSGDNVLPKIRLTQGSQEGRDPLEQA